ncbi:26S proteasome non-ATPase regulatory subunit 2 homolog A-like isoform X2 [Camellia sinensis]|uniref:26S proteasome non-ATPase regulatory subunit 2 homolog A-like isoform X2 n=1 Tax=Camellia sinensis TaxID=4442 RepID=UPI0010357323|nr:26S proteasome non-ATPase regulatory subunit 2 homolog A-like isoform X2 [Camellia sinensis]
MLFFSKILSAYEFELHAGGKTRHPSNHIYLENGKPIYSVIQELKTAPHSVNEESFQAWKESLQENSHMVKTEKRRHISVPGMHFSVVYLTLFIYWQIFTTCDDLLLKKQFCYILGQHRITFVLDEEMSGDDECRETLQGINNNGKLSEGYLMLACDIEVMEPKSSEDIYKIRSKFSRVLEDKKMPLDVIVFTAISLGLVYVGSCDEDISQTIISALKHQNLSKLGQPLTCLLPLGLDLLYLGKQKSVEGTAEISKTLNTKIRTHCDMILFSCAYAGIGDVLKVQYLLGQCAQHLKRGETHQGPTVLRIAMVAMAEELGLEMVIRC